MGALNTEIGAEGVDGAGLEIEQGEPPGTYKCWLCFEGEHDEALFDRSNGNKIPIMFETPEYDAGEPDAMKSVDRLTMFTEEGKANFTVQVETDLGSATAALSVSQSTATWGPTSLTTPLATELFWAPDGTTVPTPGRCYRWGGKKVNEATVGIPPGTLGTWCKLTARAEVDQKVVISGHVLDFQRLPERPYV